MTYHSTSDLEVLLMQCLGAGSEESSPQRIALPLSGCHWGWRLTAINKRFPFPGLRPVSGLWQRGGGGLSSASMTTRMRNQRQPAWGPGPLPCQKRACRGGWQLGVRGANKQRLFPKCRELTGKVRSAKVTSEFNWNRLVSSISISASEF